ncbi:MAG: DUF6984 family protein [Lishizhenia sp.]
MEYVTREIRPNELDLLKHMLDLAGHTLEQFPPIKEVYEYEGGKMGSIHFVGSNPDAYLGDIMQVKFKDTDNIRVVVTLTVDQEQRLLDLDFWKEDFSKLLQYPKPEEVKKAERVL